MFKPLGIVPVNGKLNFSGAIRTVAGIRQLNKFQYEVKFTDLTTFRVPINTKVLVVE